MLVFLYLFIGSSMLNFIYLLFFLKFSFRKQQQAFPEQILPVSVIVYAKNEGKNLQEFLPSILSQDHPDFEVILINDASSDETLEVMEDFEKMDPRIKIVNVANNEAFWGNKKYALTLGIKKAAHPYLLFTAADSEPTSAKWISEMSACQTSGKSIVLGHSGYFKKKHSILNKLIRYENLLTAIQYFSSALWKTPYMGAGSNLAYTSKEFYNRNGFATHLHITGGAHDLFVNQAARHINTAVCFTHDSLIRSVPKTTFKSWLNQKKNDILIARHYKTQHRILMGLFQVSQLLFWLFFFILLASPFWTFAIGLFVARLILQGVAYYGAAKKLGETDLLWVFPFLEIFLVCTQLSTFTTTIISKHNHWK